MARWTPGHVRLEAIDAALQIELRGGKFPSGFLTEVKEGSLVEAIQIARSYIKQHGDTDLSAGLLEIWIEYTEGNMKLADMPIEPTE